jgi:HK97 family phage major capsid protein
MPTPNGTVTIEDLENKLTQLRDQANSIQATGDAESRDLSEQEQLDFNAVMDAFEATEKEITRRRKLQDLDNRLAAPQPRRIQEEPTVAAAAPIERVPAGSAARSTPVASQSGSWGWRTFGEFANGVRKAARGIMDQRLVVNAPASFGGEGTNADGGYAVPPDFRAEIMKFVQGEDSLLAMTDQQTTSSNQMTVPTDGTTPWGNSGVNANWTDEGTDITLSKPALGQLTVKAYKLAALVPMTEELLEDAGAMSNYLRTKVPQKFISAINTALYSGNGTGKPTGLMTSGSKVVQAAVTGQGAGTVVATNIVKMWGRMYAPLRSGAVWLINQDVEQQLQLLAMPGTAPQVPLYLPPGGFSGAPYGTLFGRPVISLEACSAVGTEGDIMLVNPKSYLSVLKASGMRQDVSMHVYFASDITAFRFVMRVGGQSWWSAALTRQNGSNTLSNIITLNSTRT